MRKFFPFLSFLLLLSLALFATNSYRHAQRGTRLYKQYFQAESPVGYGTTRAVSAVKLEGDDSILEQGKRYHQTEDYDMALVSLRAYLESNPTPDNFLPELLAGTAAMASGSYGEARRFLQQLPEEDSDADGAALWYLGLLDLREENLEAARGKLQLLAGSPARNQYPVEDLLGRLVVK